MVLTRSNEVSYFNNHNIIIIYTIIFSALYPLAGAMCRQYCYSCVYVESERYSVLSSITKFNNEIPIFFTTYYCVQLFFNIEDKDYKKLTDFKSSATVTDPIEHRLMEIFL